MNLIPPEPCPHPADRVVVAQEWRAGDSYPDGPVLVASIHHCRDCGADLGPA